MPRFRRFSAAFLLASILLSPLLLPDTSYAKQTDSVAIVNANVITMLGDRVLAQHTIVVNDGRIVQLAPDSTIRLPAHVVSIDAGGGYLLPGLADMHVHSSAEDFPLFLANGVTTIRDLDGSPEHLQWRAQIASGERLGPTLLVSGPLVAGTPQRWRHVLVETPAAARRTVIEQAGAGYDCIKVYDGLTAASYAALVQTADSLGIPFVGHAPMDAGLRAVLGAGQRSIEHAEQIIYSLYGHQMILPESRISEAVALFAGRNTWLTPTLAVQKALNQRGTDWYGDLLQRPEMRYVGPSIHEWWQSLHRPPSREAEARRRAFLQFQRALVRALFDAGVPLLAGTDTPNPLMIPGFSLNEELIALAETGLPVYAVLQTATSNPARFLGAAGEFGVVAPGARADLLLVRKNPLDDLAHLREPLAVMVRGTWLAREKLETLLAEVAAVKAAK